MDQKDGQKRSHFNSGENVHIGNQGEFFCRSLYGLMKHPNGDRRPDLISVNGSYKPKLSMEVKASLEGRGLINPYGLTYGFNSNLDYISIFGDSIPTHNPDRLIEDMEYDRFNGLQESAFYYNLIQRTDNMRRNDFKHKYSDLSITFGDQMILPHELIFYAYVLGKMSANEQSFDQAFKSVKRIVTDFITEGYDYSSHRIEDLQAVHMNDFLAIFMNDFSLLKSDEAKKRVELLQTHYGDDRLSRLERIEYVGPNNTRICAFYKPEHADLFVTQMRERIGSRRDMLTRLTKRRLKEAATMPVGFCKAGDMFPMDGIRQLKQHEEAHLDRLLEWRHAEDQGVEFSAEHPDNVEPPGEKAKEFLPFG